MALYVCRKCSARFAVGLARCPQCTAEDAYLDESDPQVTVLPEPAEVVEVDTADVADTSGRRKKPAAADAAPS